MLTGIKEIVDVNSFKLILRFENNEKREVDFQRIFSNETKENPNSVFNLLKDEKIFPEVKLNEEFHTIYWENLTTYIDYDGEKKKGPLDISPEFLYENSKPIS